VYIPLFLALILDKKRLNLSNNSYKAIPKFGLIAFGNKNKTLTNIVARLSTI
jgi:hypothetical protein